MWLAADLATDYQGGLTADTGLSEGCAVILLYLYTDTGNVLGVASDSLDQNLEVEAFWVWDF